MRENLSSGDHLRRDGTNNLEVFGERRQGQDRILNAKHLVHRLQEQERRKGLNGIHEVWISRRRVGFDLPTDDTPEAEFLWGTFVKDAHVVPELLQHAAELRTRTGQVYKRLYELCIAYWLPHGRQSKKTLAYHQFMRRELQLEQLPLRDLARINKGRLTVDMYDTLLEMYKDSNEINLYDEIVPALRRSPARALRWHAACVMKGDLPSPEVASSPFVQAFLAQNATSSNPEVRAKAAIAANWRADHEQMDQVLLRRLRGRDTPPVRFEDSFCARMFATKAVPPDSVIRGLALVGVNEIGPLAVRAMASRTEPISELPRRFEELRAAGIALQGCVFSLALEQFAQQGHYFLVRSMLESDQHPEVYDNSELQTKLLQYYLDQQDLDQARRTLAILSLFHKKRSTQAWNLLLQIQSKRAAPDEILETLQSMAKHQIWVDATTIAMLKSNILRPRRRGMQPVRRTGDHRKGFDDLRFVARMYLFILENKIGQISPFAWHEILRRFGMTGRMRELRRLVHWLFCWYAPRGSVPLKTIREPGFLEPRTESLRRSNPQEITQWKPLSPQGQTHKRHPLRQLFPDRFKQALIVWGFRAGLLSNAPVEQSMLSGVASKQHYRVRFRQNGILEPLAWDIGLKTLAELRYLCLYVNSQTVVKALQMMFINLFGRGRSRNKQNRIMQAVNTITYPEYVHRVNEIWGTPLFPEPRMYNKSGLHSLMWHPRFDRVVHRKGHLKLSDIAAGINKQVGHVGPRISYVETDVRQHDNDRLDMDAARLDKLGAQDAHDGGTSDDSAFDKVLDTFRAHDRALEPDASPISRNFNPKTSEPGSRSDVVGFTESLPQQPRRQRR